MRFGVSLTLSTGPHELFTSSTGPHELQGVNLPHAGRRGSSRGYEAGDAVIIGVGTPDGQPWSWAGDAVVMGRVTGGHMGCSHERVTGVPAVVMGWVTRT